MKKTAGFTLIELVIVIVILGILGAVAAPKFLNLQGDAYKANVNALKGSIQSATTLANVKAVLNGFDKEAEQEVDSTQDFKAVDTGKGDIVFVYGFPAQTADEKGIIGMLQDSGTFKTDETGVYKISTDDTIGLKISPKQRSATADACFVTYKAATATTAPVITSDTSNC